MDDGNSSRRLQEGAVASSNALTLFLPNAGEAPAERGNQGGRDDVWSQSATVTLIEAWGNRYLELNRGNLKQKHWKEVADAVNTRPGSNTKQPKTDVQCKNRLDTLKKKYKVEKSRIVGGGVSKWGLFNRMDELIGPSRKSQLQVQKPLNHISPTPPLPPPPPAAAAPLLHTAAAPSTEMAIPNVGANNYNGNQQRVNNTESPDMTESWANDRRHQVDHGAALKEVATAIVKFGEVYERIEVLKQQQIMDLEKQRMEFMKDLELQRMHLFMQTQLELAKIKHGKQENSTGNVIMVLFCRALFAVNVQSLKLETAPALARQRWRIYVSLPYINLFTFCGISITSLGREDVVNWMDIENFDPGYDRCEFLFYNFILEKIHP